MRLLNGIVRIVILIIQYIKDLFLICIKHSIYNFDKLLMDSNYLWL